MTAQPNRRPLSAMLTAVAAAALLAGCGGESDDTPVRVLDADDSALKFDAAAYLTVNVTLDGVATRVRQYRVVYVAKPIRMATTQIAGNGSATTLADPFTYQTMIILVPEGSVDDQKNAVYLAVSNSGWFASPAATTINEGATFVSTNNTNHIGAALKAGYVVVNAGTRSRGIRAADGRYVGKSPAPVVDVKAAIRYLRLNDAAMPGSAERIVLNGTSGGGGLTSAVAASGNSADYMAYLAEIGAAGVDESGATVTSTIRDDVFAAVAYCPINNLGNADAGYEWEYGATRTDANTPALGGIAYSAGAQPSASTAIAASFGPYVISLGLTRGDGSALTDGNLRDSTIAFLTQEINRQLVAGNAVPALGANFSVTQQNTNSQVVNDWLALTGSGTAARVASIDYPKFLKFVTTPIRLKSVVAFDSTGVTGNPGVTGENTLFGTDSYAHSNYSAWSWANNSVRGDGTGVDDTGLSWTAVLASTTSPLAAQLKLINPLAYLNTAADTAPYWYVRHGMIDRDTAFAMQTLLYHAIKKDASVREVDFKLPYLVPHSGNYDVQEAFAWIKAKLAANP